MGPWYGSIWYLNMLTDTLSDSPLKPPKPGCIIGMTAMVWPLAAGGSAQRLAATRRPFRGGSRLGVWVAKTMPHIVTVVYSTIYQRTFNIL